MPDTKLTREGIFRLALAVLGALVLSCGAGAPVTVPPDADRLGFASWYGPGFHGRKTASGEIYDQNGLTAAHRTFPFGTTVRVTHTATRRSVDVRINDRGPFVRGRVIDLSRAAAERIGLVEDGTAPVQLLIVGRGDPSERYYVQVGSFREEANASRRLADFRRRVPGRPASLVRQDGLNRVWVGPVEAEEDAVKLVDELREAGFAGFVLRR